MVFFPVSDAPMQAAIEAISVEGVIGYPAENSKPGGWDRIRTSIAKSGQRSLHKRQPMQSSGSSAKTVPDVMERAFLGQNATHIAQALPYDSIMRITRGRLSAHTA